MNILALIITFPLIGFILLAFSRGRYSENLSAIIGTGSVGLSALLTFYIGIIFFKNGCQSFSMPLWSWILINNFDINFNLVLDGLSLTMISIITIIGFLIHVFASWYMKGKEGYSRFFAYTNLFITSMIVLVLADNLLFMYFGWEGVSLCSYLLIGFYYSNTKNIEASVKAFIMARIGDMFLVFALFILYDELGTLNFREMFEITPLICKDSITMLWLATLMLLVGAAGKSAQLPLQTWLADAMAGPTPVSALIHATTMVTAGVYLIIRANILFITIPEILHLVGIIGTVTMILASFSALVQTDIKRILAYSTMSQIGYMFLALGVQAWNAAIFHLMTHSFFKALLFLSSGSVILTCNHEQNIFKMGGLRKSIPLVYTCFIVGGASLSALPLITAGFFSKDKILIGAMVNGNTNLMIAGLVCAFITPLYIFRMIFVIFHGKRKILTYIGKGIAHNLPLIVLLVLSTFIGALITPPLSGVLPNVIEPEHNHALILKVISSVAAVSGILIASLLWLGRRALVNVISNNLLIRLLTTWWYNAWGFDWLYNLIFVKPFFGVASFLRHDPLNLLMNIPVTISCFISNYLLLSENGSLRWYIVSMSIGAVAILMILMY